jgi:sulfur transfer complex TusBCD TusB component (DsrH family)
MNEPQSWGNPIKLCKEEIQLRILEDVVANIKDPKYLEDVVGIIIDVAYLDVDLVTRTLQNSRL